MRHVSREINPREAGLTPYHIQFTREESPPVRSLLDEGFWYTHPAQNEDVIVWAKDAASIPEVLTYHYHRSWSGLNVLPSQPAP